jgi:hypothetical protein
MEYRYIGHGGYMLGVPARDLDAADVLEVQEREGIGALEIEASGLYEPARWQEVAPFCGSMRDGRRCWRPVAVWGERCEEHEDGRMDSRFPRFCEDGNDGREEEVDR